MSNEREMLEYAAKACGLNYKLGENGAILEILEDGNAEWNSLTNSADCWAMCSYLTIDTYWYSSGDIVSCVQRAEDFIDYTALVSDHNNDREAAWRYAVTMVAAKLGGMK